MQFGGTTSPRPFTAATPVRSPPPTEAVQRRVGQSGRRARISSSRQYNCTLRRRSREELCAGHPCSALDFFNDQAVVVMVPAPWQSYWFMRHFHRPFFGWR
uniref:Uncharacterized protein n=1 Tax=Triticum urartu TaxID=4572 RepID=A0A8R7P4Q9_TRIUA